MKFLVKRKAKNINSEEKYFFFNKWVFIHWQEYIYGHILYGHTHMDRVEGPEVHGVFILASSKVRNNAAFLHFLL